MPQIAHDCGPDPLRMEEIQDIVTSIVKGCGHGGFVCSDVLAAFIAKTVSSRVRVNCVWCRD